jgi:hypothetical protein
MAEVPPLDGIVHSGTVESTTGDAGGVVDGGDPGEVEVGAAGGRVVLVVDAGTPDGGAGLGKVGGGRVGADVARGGDPVPAGADGPVRGALVVLGGAVPAVVVGARVVGAGVVDAGAPVAPSA